MSRSRLDEQATESAEFCDFQGLCADIGLNTMGTETTSHTSEIRFETAAKSLVEALPLGNGILGALAYGRAGGETLTRNRHDAWSGNKNSPNQHVPAFNEEHYLGRVRALIDEGDNVQAEEYLKKAQSTHSQAFLPYADIDVSTDGTAFPEPHGHVVRALNFESARSVSHYALNADSHITHTTYLPRVRRAHRTTYLVHLVTNSGPHDTTVTLTARTLLRGSASGRDGYLIELPSDVAPTHEANPAHIRYLGSAPRVGWLAVAAALTTASAQESSNPTASTSTASTPAAHSAASSSPSNPTTSAPVASAPVATDHTARVCEPEPAGSSEIESDPTELTATYQLPARSSLVIVIESPAIEQLDKISGSPQMRQSQIASALRERVQTTAEHARATALDIACDLHTHMSDHVTEHHKVYGTMSLEVPDHRVTRQFNFGRYLLARAHAPHAMPLNLQGLWCHDIPAPWSSNYTLNINTPMNYWGVEAAGLPQLHESLIEWLEMVAKGPGKAAAENLYGLPGMVLHHNADMWGHALPAGAGAGDASWAYWPLGALWLTRQAWDHYEYGQDPFVLKRIWPLIEQVGLFAESWIVQDGGTSRTYPSVSPENRYLLDGAPVSVSSTVTMDKALLEDFAAYAQRAHAALFGGRARQPQWLNSLARKVSTLPPYQVGERGQLQEWIEDFEEVEPQHRHLSHLVGVYPLGTLTSERLRAAARRTLTLRGDDSTGWSLAWRIGLWARLGEPAKVLDAIERSLRPAVRTTVSDSATNTDSADAENGPDDTEQGSAEHRGGIYSNLLSAHPPFQIDGNYGFVAGGLEALCTVESERIKVLPALPATWGTGRVQGVRLRGAFTANLSWESAQDLSFELTDTRTTGKLRTPTIELTNGQLIELDIRPGETYRITVKNREISKVARVS